MQNDKNILSHFFLFSNLMPHRNFTIFLLPERVPVQCSKGALDDPPNYQAFEEKLLLMTHFH